MIADHKTRISITIDTKLLKAYRKAVAASVFKRTVSEALAAHMQYFVETEAAAKAAAPKRPRGRPKKNPS
jgi:uncharacterized protein (DUF4415 family)